MSPGRPSFPTVNLRSLPSTIRTKGTSMDISEMRVSSPGESQRGRLGDQPL